jgi:pimeloyl-ACP methyl ester carboxylesterase
MQAADPASNLFLTDFRACDAYRGALDAAARVACPVTIVAGRRDQMTMPKDAAALASALETTPVVIDSGHALMTEAPDGVLKALRSALGV